MVQAWVAVGEPGALATGEHKCVAGQILRSLTLPARQTEVVTLRTVFLNHAEIFGSWRVEGLHPSHHSGCQIWSQWRTHATGHAPKLDRRRRNPIPPIAHGSIRETNRPSGLLT